MTTAAVVKVGRTPTGFWVRIEGRGTLRESPAVAAFAHQVLAGPDGDLLVDLSGCDYLDSTFLGCLVQLHKQYGMQEPARLETLIQPETAERILSPTHLDQLLNLTQTEPVRVGSEMVLPGVELSLSELAHHALECHQQLLGLGGRNAAIFGPVVEGLQRDVERLDRRTARD